MRNEPIVYIDETTINNWMRPSYFWCPKSSYFSVPMQPNRSRGLTIIGAISEVIDKGGYFEITDSTNTVDFSRFMRNLATKLTLPALSLIHI